MSYSWQGSSGRWYPVDVARAKRDWPRVGGIYMFVKPADASMTDWGGPVVLYLAKTNDFAAALGRHDMWAAAQQLGAGEIHLLEIETDQERAFVEQDLIEAQRPILNRQMLRRVA